MPEQPEQPERHPAAGVSLSEQGVETLAADAYVYGFPLMLMDVTRQVMTAVPKADAHKAPINQFLHVPTFPDHTFPDVVSPNADTLYSIAWLHLAKEPMVLTVPAVGKRYYVMQMCDAWTNVFAAPGTRTTGNSERDFAIVGPQWKGTLPHGVTGLRSPTNLVWVIGRTQTNGWKDYAAVHAIQAQYALTPLTALGTSDRRPDHVPVDQGLDLRTAPVEQVARMGAATFFGRLSTLMQDNPPADVDGIALSRFAALGIARGRSFNTGVLTPTLARGLEQGLRAGRERILTETRKPQGRTTNGWSVMTNLGRYGTSYLFRAVVALVGLGANLPEDAVYPHATVDAEGRPLTGAARYVIRFAHGQLPPVAAFWSVTMYNTRQFFVENRINRYAIGDRDALSLDPDGSLTLYLQHESPGKEKESNWLPAPATGFNVFMRLYWPKKEILDGTWNPPGITRVS